MNSTLINQGLRATILIVSFWVLTLSLTGVGGSLGAVGGALIGLWLLENYLPTPTFVRIRVTFVGVSALVAVTFAWWLSELLTDSVLWAAWLTPLATYHLAEALFWFVFALMVTAVLGYIRHRTTFGVVVEAMLIAAVFASALAAHRQGMVHRPFFIGDFALVRGIDPASILLALGCLVLVALAALFIQESNARRLPYHLLVLVLLCGTLAGYIKLFGLPAPALTDQMQLTGRSQEENSGGSRSDNPFRDFSDQETEESKESPVAIVLFRDDYEPEEGTYYFRQSAYSDFNGYMLDEARDRDIDQDLVDYFTASEVDVSNQVPGKSLRTPVRVTVGLLTSHREPFGLDAPTKFVNTPNPNTMRFKRTYDAYSMVPNREFEDLVDRQLGAADWTEEQWQRYLALPDDPRYRQQAENIIERLNPDYADKPYAQALVIKNYLDVNGIYDLKTKHANAPDPAASFLFGDLTGYCMHFSFAATYMFRSLGIPARVGLGYAVPTNLRAGGSALLIQAVNAHAWPEIYLRGVGWVIVDPSPQQTNVDMTQQPQTGLQQLLADLLRDQESFNEYLQAQQRGSIPWQQIFLGLAIALALLIAASYAIRIYRLWIPAHGAEAVRYRLAYRAALDRLAAFGVVRRFGETREAFALRVKTLSPSFLTLTENHLQVALGNAQPAATANWVAIDRQIERELAAANPWWRHGVAWLNPFSWLRTK